MPTRIRTILLAIGALLLFGTPVAWYLAQPSPTAGELPEALDVRPVDDLDDEDVREDETDGSDVDGDDEPQQDPADEAVEERSPIVIEAAPGRPAKPVSVSVPSIGVDGAEVVEVGLDANRAVEIPDDVQQVGWYNRGPRPGEDGNAFMTSHVDSRSQGRGVLFDLRRSEPGDLIEVTHEDGSVTEWEVVFRERIVKGSYPMDRVFRFDGPPGLVIDTCGGPFDPNTGSYENIDIVYAVPLGADYSNVDIEAADQSG